MIGGWADVEAVVGQANARGFGWLTFQQEDTPAGFRPRIQAACHARGMLCGPWEAQVDFGTPARTADGWDFYIGQVEGPNQYTRLQSSLGAFRAAHPTMPAAVVTNFGGLDTPELAAPLINAGFACITESHIREDPGGTVEGKLDYAARVLGWPDPQPMAGLGAGATLKDYPTLQGHPGWSVFALEELL